MTVTPRVCSGDACRQICRRDYSALRWWLDFSGNRRVPLQRLMSPRFVVVATILEQNLVQVLFVQNDHVVQALSPDRTDNPFDIWVLPGTMGRDHDFLNAHALDSAAEHVAVHAVTIT